MITKIFLKIPSDEGYKQGTRAGTPLMPIFYTEAV